MIGIIGGNGVAATNRLLYLIEHKITEGGAYRDAHHPEMLVMQATQAPSRSMYLEGRGPSFIDDYILIGRKMKLFGCTKLCMCCNTAHFALPVLEESIGLTFIDMINATLTEAVKLGKKKIGIICSDGCRKGNVYDKAAKTISHDIELVYPDNSFQKLATEGICNTKNLKRLLPDSNPESPVYKFRRVCNNLLDKGAETVISGCTDINAVFNNLNFNSYDGG